jgi:hypothetical protein
MRITLTAIVVDSVHASNSDCHFGQSLAPRPAKTVGNNHRNSNLELALQLTAELFRRAIWIPGQQKRMKAAIHIGYIYAAIGANKSMASFSNEDTALAAHDTGSFS